jgi:benzoyl-CoA 2,3-dioxygenase component B
MVKVHEPGRFANYIAPPAQGTNNQPIDFEYVRIH